MTDEKNDKPEKIEVIVVPETMIVKVVEELGRAGTYDNVAVLIHQIVTLVVEQRKAREPKIITGVTP